MTTLGNQVPPAPRPSVWRQIRAAVTHPAGVAFLLLWLLAAVALALRGHSNLLPQIAFPLVMLNIIPILLLLRQTPHSPEAEAPRNRRVALWCQVAFITAIIVLAMLGAMSHYGIIPAGSPRVPLWTPVEQALMQVGERLFGLKGAVRNPVLHVLLPGAVLLLCGVRPAEMGLRRGYRSWAVSVPYLILLGFAVGLPLLVGDTSGIYLAPQMMLRNLVMNGFTEEFLFRGALQSRLTALVGEGWGLVLSALVFGVSHLGPMTAMVGGDWLAGLAVCIAGQAPAGLLFGLLAIRTRSLIAPTVAHVVLNLFG